jgi:hypothetical protein
LLITSQFYFPTDVYEKSSPDETHTYDEPIILDATTDNDGSPIDVMPQSHSSPAYTETIPNESHLERSSEPLIIESHPHDLPVELFTQEESNEMISDSFNNSSQSKSNEEMKKIDTSVDEDFKQTFPDFDFNILSKNATNQHIKPEPDDEAMIQSSYNKGNLSARLDEMIKGKESHDDDDKLDSIMEHTSLSKLLLDNDEEDHEDSSKHSSQVLKSSLDGASSSTTSFTSNFAAFDKLLSSQTSPVTIQRKISQTKFVLTSPKADLILQTNPRLPDHNDQKKIDPMDEIVNPTETTTIDRPDHDITDGDALHSQRKQKQSDEVHQQHTQSVNNDEKIHSTNDLRDSSNGIDQVIDSIISLEQQPQESHSSRSVGIADHGKHIISPQDQKQLHVRVDDDPIDIILNNGHKNNPNSDDDSDDGNLFGDLDDIVKDKDDSNQTEDHNGNESGPMPVKSHRSTTIEVVTDCNTPLLHHHDTEISLVAPTPSQSYHDTVSDPSKNSQPMVNTLSNVVVEDNEDDSLYDDNFEADDRDEEIMKQKDGAVKNSDDQPVYEGDFDSDEGSDDHFFDDIEELVNRAKQSPK